MVPLALFLVALIARIVVGAAFPGPANPDSYYYVHVAQQLAAGHGFVADYVWNLDDVGRSLLDSSTLPIPANGLWMPFAEIVQVPFIWLFGSAGSEIATWIIGALAAPLTYWIGRDAGFDRRSVAIAGVMTAIPAALLSSVAQPDSMALFMLLGTLSLWLCARGMRGDRRAFALGGAVVGLATLTRADGALLGLPFALAFGLELWRRRERLIGWPTAAACFALFLVVMAPWLWRQYEVYGTFLPTAGSGRLMWLTYYGQLFSVSDAPSLSGWLAQGAPAILGGVLGGFVAAITLFVLTPLAGVLAPFAVIGGIARRSDRAFWPFFIYALALFLVMGVLFPVVITHGTFLHAAAALVPYTYLLVVAGVERSVQWVAQRRASWDPMRATRFFTVTAAAVAVIAAAGGAMLALRTWSEVQSVQREISSPLHGAPTGDRFMAADPGAINYLTSRQGLLTPDDDLDVIEQVMRSYGVRWLVLEGYQVVPALEPVLNGDVHPEWLSNPVAVVAGATSSSPAAALYAVCFSATDTRCQ